MLIEQTKFQDLVSAAVPRHDCRTADQQSVAEKTSEPFSARALELRAAVLLHSHPHLQRYSTSVQCCIRDRCLVLVGTMPSFYLKQLAQESLRELTGVERIENRISVVEASESRVRPHATQSQASFSRSHRPHFHVANHSQRSR